MTSTPKLGRIFLTRTTAEWMKLLVDADIPVMPIHDLESILQDEHLAETNFFALTDHPSEGLIRSMKVGAPMVRHAGSTGAARATPQ